jgi:glycosyltransferase involved in cell wall biosynthesis
MTRVLLWHVHGSWTTSFVQGDHDYLLPTLPEGGPWGLGRAGRDWPDRVVEVPADRLADTDVDVVLLQRPEEVELAARWLRRTPGVDVPAIYVEHNTPKGDVPTSRHPMADRPELLLVHVTHFNQVMWDTGTTPTAIVEHGVVDPGPRYVGDLARVAVVVNEPVRRGRVTGTDLLPHFASAAPLDVYGMGLKGLRDSLGLPADRLVEVGDLNTTALHRELARRRVYAHPMRWTSLGLSLIEAMHLGMPVVVLASTEAVRAVPPEAGVVSTRIDDLVQGAAELVSDPELARHQGKQAREFALANYGLAAFLRRWDHLLTEVSR